MSAIQPVILKTIAGAIGSTSGLPVFGANNFPANSDELLVWITWGVGAGIQADRWMKPNAEDMVNTIDELYAFEETPVGDSSGTEEILLPFNVPADAVMVYEGSCTAFLDIANNKITMTAGTIRNIVISEFGLTARNPEGSAMLNPDDSYAANP